jgi:hypothetical protein
MDIERCKIIEDFDTYFEHERKKTKENYVRIVVRYLDDVLCHKIGDAGQTTTTSDEFNKTVSDLYALYSTAFMYILVRKQKKQYYVALGYVYLSTAEFAWDSKRNYYEESHYYRLAFNAFHAALRFDRTNILLLELEWIAATCCAVQIPEKIIRITRIFGSRKSKKVKRIKRLCNDNTYKFSKFLYYKGIGFVYHRIEKYAKAYVCFRKALSYNSNDYMTLAYCRDAGVRYYAGKTRSKDFAHGVELQRLIKKIIPSGAHPLERYILSESNEDVAISYRRKKKEIPYPIRVESKLKLILQEVRKMKISKQKSAIASMWDDGGRRITILTNADVKGKLLRRILSDRIHQDQLQKRKEGLRNYLIWLDYQTGECYILGEPFRRMRKNTERQKAWEKGTTQLAISRIGIRYRRLIVFLLKESRCCKYKEIYEVYRGKGAHYVSDKDHRKSVGKLLWDLKKYTNDRLKEYALDCGNLNFGIEARKYPWCVINYESPFDFVTSH